MENKITEYRFGDSLIIGIDHGFGNMKTRHHIFRSGLKEYSAVPTFGSDILEYGDKYYLIGEGHKAFKADKVEDEDYYILTLAAVAKELKYRGLAEADVILAVGLPIMWMAQQRRTFAAYLMKNPDVSFRYKGKAYQIHIRDVKVFPQGFAAVAANTARFTGINMLADIGNGTMNTLYINNHKVSAQKYYTDKLGVQQCVMQIRNQMLAEAGTDCGEELVEDFLIRGTADMKPEFLALMKREAEEYVKSIFDKLREYEFNPALMRLYVVGGGGCLVKNFGHYDTERVEIITDICATAKGYEVAAYSKLHTDMRKRA